MTAWKDVERAEPEFAQRRLQSVIDELLAAARSPAVRSGRKIEFRGVGSRPYQVVLRVSEPPRALRGDRTCRCE
jgi:hypothetical protein